MSGQDPQERLIDAGALTVGALVYGDADGPSVLMTHGQADSAWSLDPLARHLSDRFRVITVDLRGHGRSDRGAYTLPHLIGDLVGVCEALSLVDPIVIGHSLGGQAAAQFCGVYPEIPRAAILIESLGPPPRVDEQRLTPEAQDRRWTRMRAEMVRVPARSRAQPSLAAAIDRFRQLHPLLDAERAAFLVEKNTRPSEPGEDGDPQARWWRHDPLTRDWLAGHDHDKAEARWQGITCPVQIVLGADAYERFWSQGLNTGQAMDGPMSDDELARRMSKFADGRVEVVAGAGHMVHYDRPDELNRIIDRFLKEIGAP